MGKIEESFIVENAGQSSEVHIYVNYGFSSKIKVEASSKTLIDEKIGFRHKNGEAFIVNGRVLEIRWIWSEWSGKPKSIVVVNEAEQIIWMHKSDLAAKVDIYEKMPKWGWFFVILTGAIPVIALGGFVPVVIGFGGATLCRNISANHKQSTAVKVTLCLITTLISWALFIGFIYAMTALT